MRNRSRITSQSDQSDDDQIFTPVVHTRSKFSSLHHSHESSHHEGDDSNNIEGTRRSTRKRKLKYENYSDTWIVGSQSLKGYPNMVNVEENVPRRITRNLRLKQVVVDDEEEEDEADNNTNEQEIQQEEEIIAPMQSGNSKQHDKKMLSFVSEKNESRPRTRRAVAEASDKSNDHPNVDCEDLYTRIKRTRRSNQTKPITTEQSSDESMSSEELNNLSNIEDYLTSINKLNVKKKRRTIRLKQCSIRPSNRPRYYRYSLRKVKPTVQRFQIHTESNTRAIKTPSKMVNGPRKRRASSSSESSSSSLSDNDLETINQSQVIKKPKSHTRDDKSKKKTALEDIKPVIVDSGIGFHNVGGLQEHIDCLREMVVFPMIYKDVFEMFEQNPAKGVIFHGPPGTGKTLLARALANECSKSGQKVSFFVRKSADVLCKWVGESERQLRLLFDKAKEMKPSIIFFDELDGLVPVRSGKQDQVHNSIVTTMLAMMDGLENRGDVIVIGATNRIDSIDPALRRPGRFDKELYFPLPTDKNRLQILRIIISKWKNPLSDELLKKLAEETVGYTGADLNSLCSESVLQALNRTYPQIYKTSNKLLLDLNKIQVIFEDFEKAMSKIIPTTERNVVLNPKKLPSIYRPLYENTLQDLISYISKLFPELNSPSNQRLRVAKAPRLLVHSLSDSKNVLVVPALLQHFENCYRHTLSCVTIFSNPAYSPEEAIVQIFKELPKHLPAILFIPNIGEFWTSLSYPLQKLFSELMDSMDITLPVLTFATSLYDIKDLPNEVLDIFSGEKRKYSIPNPSENSIRALYSILIDKALTPPVIIDQQSLEELPIAPPPSPTKLSETELKNIISQEENTLRELRIFLRDICAKLARNKQFFMFTKPVDIEEVPDYLEIIKEPMDLETVMSKIDKHCYICARDFLDDIDLIVRNALEYNPDKSAEDKHIRHRACSLRDKAYAFIKAEMDSDFEDTCRDIRDKRKIRNATEIEQTCVPDFVHTIKKEQQIIEKDDHLEDNCSRRKKRRNMWQKGLTPKKKRYSKNSKDHDDNSVNDNSSHPTINGFDINGIDESSNDSNHSMVWVDRSTSPSPIPNEINHVDLLPENSKQELKIDKNMFEILLHDDVMKFWDEIQNWKIDDGIIDLFSLLDNKISLYLEKWDRTTLILELKTEFEDFKIRYVEENMEKKK
ncbi:ATPase family AAA domain-containing protein 2-like [Sipha flava]|uniref:ATPase family AAA domain-containing protein 2-like n=2 Tax=Sipha flava TaxID=143950 RepID=A0A8B8GRJ7_9HEMI|nr:ATPase family AAA domain-containing protein 2-like [Sipha flava]